MSGANILRNNESSPKCKATQPIELQAPVETPEPEQAEDSPPDEEGAASSEIESEPSLPCLLYTSDAADE